jgi:hypothetical protein
LANAYGKLDAGAIPAASTIRRWASALTTGGDQATMSKANVSRQVDRSKTGIKADTAMMREDESNGRE